MKKQKQILPARLIFDMYNFSGNEALLSPLGNNHQEHAGVVNLTKDVKLTGEEFVGLMRIMLYSDNYWLDLLCTEAFLFGKKINLMNLFSPFQFQKGIIDLPVCGKIKDIDFKKTIAHGKNIRVSYFLMPELKEHPRTNIVDIEYLNKPTMWCYFRNATSKSVKVDLIELCKGNELEGIELIHNHFQIKEEGMMQHFTQIAVASDKPKNLTLPLDFDAKGSGVIQYVNPNYSNHQWQNNIINDEVDLKIYPSSKLMVTIPPRDTMMYCFR